MIVADQPTCFGDQLLVRFSSRGDGAMLNRTIGRHASEVVANRREFCLANGVLYDDMVYQVIQYGVTELYNKLVDVTEENTVKYTDGIAADGLFTMQRGVGLFLPVADCVATVVYDPVKQLLVVLHMGRHSTCSDLIEVALQRFQSAGADPANLIVWMGPSAQQVSYRLKWFDAKDEPDWQGFYDVKGDGYYLDMPGYNKAQFLRHGVNETNIHISRVNTMKSEHYFSHATGDIDGRMALLAVMQ